jgi:hypothetical protein
LFTGFFSSLRHDGSLLKRNELTGARLGLSEHPEDNQHAFGFQLNARDNQEIEEILEQSNSRRMITTIGDCGAEYRLI